MRVLFMVFLVVISGGAFAQGRLVFETAENLRPFAAPVANRLQAAGIDAEIRFVPTARMAEDLREGAVDGAFFVTEHFISTSSVYTLVPVPLYKNEYVAVSRDPLTPIHRASDLAAYSVAFARGNSTVTTLAQNAGRSVPAVDEEQAFRLLGAGRVQVVLASRTSVQLFSAAAGGAVVVHEPTLSTAPLYLCVRRSLSGARDALGRVLQASLDDGSWAREVRAIIEGFGRN